MYLGGLTMENERLLKLLEQMENSNRKQVLYARLQFIFTALSSLCCIVLLICGLKVLPQLQSAAIQAETVLTNLETVTTELAESDLIGMVENIDSLVGNVDGLVSTSQTGVEQAIEKINAINFDALNEAIEDLSAVIEPIAKFFKTVKIG